MGRRSRKRGGLTTRAERDAARRAPAPRRPPASERPPAPWGSFPLSELVILVGIVVMVWGFLSGRDRGEERVAAGLAAGVARRRRAGAARAPRRLPLALRAARRRRGVRGGHGGGADARPGQGLGAAARRRGRLRRRLLRDARAVQAPLRRAGLPVRQRTSTAGAAADRGLHHMTLICSDVERSVDFYRNLLGMRLVKRTVNEDDRGARHLLLRRRGRAAGNAGHLPGVPGAGRGHGRAAGRPTTSR